MIISGITAYRIEVPGDVWLWVAVETDVGLTGWGEATDSGNDEAMALLLERIGSDLLGKNPTHILDNTAQWYDWRFPGHRSDRLLASAWSALDQAMWDLAAQSLKLPLYRLLGAFGHSEIPLYANLNRALRKNRSPEALYTNAKEAFSNGFTMVKCTPFDEMTPLMERDALGKGFQRIEAVLDAVNAEHLAIDCHQRLNRRAVCEMIEWISSKGIPYWIEDAFPASHQEDWLEMRIRFPKIRWAAGETALGLEDLWESLHQGKLDVLMPDVKHASGVSTLRTVIPIAEQRGMRVSLHNPSGPISTAVSAHLTALCRHSLPMEFPFGFSSARNDATWPSEPISNGIYKLSETPGIGLKPAPDFLREFGKYWFNGKWVSKSRL